MRKKASIEGLYLWEVEVEYAKYLADRGHSTLLITTPTNSVMRAIQKANTYLHRNRYDFPKYKVDGVKQTGRLAS